jgi:hypothetical protein
MVIKHGRVLNPYIHTVKISKLWKGKTVKLEYIKFC